MCTYIEIMTFQKSGEKSICALDFGLTLANSNHNNAMYTFNDTFNVHVLRCDSRIGFPGKVESSRSFDRHRREIPPPHSERRQSVNQRVALSSSSNRRHA